LTKPDLNLDATTPTSDGHMTVAPFAPTDGVPKVVLFIRTDIASVYEAKLDRHPAVAVFLGKEGPGETGNAPWILGDLLIQQWE
jgi:hypothetical protein